MKTYITPLGSPTFSALGPLARRGSRTSTTNAVRVIQLADSPRLGRRVDVVAGIRRAEAEELMGTLEGSVSGA
jgi:hypothetical protein